SRPRRRSTTTRFDMPLGPFQPSRSVLSNWSTRIADALTEQLPPGYLAEEYTSTSPTVEGGARRAPQSLLTVLPEPIEVRVFSTATGLTLVGAIELVSPSNKDRAHAGTSSCQAALYSLRRCSARSSRSSRPEDRSSNPSTAHWTRMNSARARSL